MQLGKLGAFQTSQGLGCKTGHNRAQSDQPLISEKQNGLSLYLTMEPDDGTWSLGWHNDAPRPFEILAFARAAAAMLSQRQHADRWLHQ
jgi:hypothetical protein